MEDVLDTLMNIEFPQQDRTNVGKYQGFVLGMVNSWAGKGDKAGRRQLISRKSEQPKYQHIMKISFDLMKNYDKDFKFSTIQFNKNKQMPKHIDGRNIGESYILGLGDYKGGELIVYDEYDNPSKIDIKNKFYKFNGSKYYHETAEFTGNRFTLVFYQI